MAPPPGRPAAAGDRRHAAAADSRSETQPSGSAGRRPAVTQARAGDLGRPLVELCHTARVTLPPTSDVPDDQGATTGTRQRGATPPPPPPASPPPPPPPLPPAPPPKNNGPLIIGVIAGVLALCLLGTCVVAAGALVVANRGDDGRPVAVADGTPPVPSPTTPPPPSTRETYAPPEPPPTTEAAPPPPPPAKIGQCIVVSEGRRLPGYRQLQRHAGHLSGGSVGLRPGRVR